MTTAEKLKALQAEKKAEPTPQHMIEVKEYEGTWLSSDGMMSREVLHTWFVQALVFYGERLTGITIHAEPKPDTYMGSTKGDR